MKRTLFCKGLLSFLLFLSTQTTHAQTQIRGLVILIDFPDFPANISLTRANDLINGVGYTEPTATRSLRDYWYAQSRGKVVVTHDVIGDFRAPQTAAYYNTRPWIDIIALFTQALNWVVANNPSYNWNALSLANGPMNRTGYEEGRFLSINLMTTAWIPGTGGTHDLPDWTAPNGVSTRQIVAATFKSPWDANVNLFWITHEQGHMIWGWPDTYDYTNSSMGTGIYTLMSGNQGTGDIEPPGAPFLAAEKWVNIIDITTQPVVLTQDGNTIARFRNPNDPLEYFVIEARMNTTIGNYSFPVPRGLLIWHVDEHVTTSNIYPQMTPTQHYRISVEQADGLFQLEGNINPGDAGDVYVPGKVFNDIVIPDAKWWNGNASTLSISNIQFLSNDRISFNATNQVICSAGNSGSPKFFVCHNNQTICVEGPARTAHLNHGDLAGACQGNVVNREDLIVEQNVLNGSAIYPNPNSGQFIISLNFPDKELSNARIEIINSTGQVIKQINVNGQKDLNISLKEKGIFLVRVAVDDQMRLKKFVVVQ